MRALLTGYVPADDVEGTATRLAGSGITIRPASAADAMPLLQFAGNHFPHWEAYVRGNLRSLISANEASTLHVALHNGEVIGFALTNGERFGPFGVNEAYRGQGVGAVLLSRALCAMRARNIHTAYFLWTSDQTARLYARHGFEIVRRFTMVSKKMENEQR
jgi:N-acetylglutamate synthase-like GNAT family acetyltransferase